MKKNHGFAVIGVIAGIAIALVLIFLTVQVIQNKNSAVDFSSYTTSVIAEASDDNGNIADHVKGDPNAPVQIVEYTNYGCTHCASMTPIADQLVEEYNGQLAVISRNVLMSAFQNSKAAAAAAEAAGLQGYWQPYSKLLFENQSEWAYANNDERTQLFEKYFTEVSDGKGNLDQFRTDLTSEAIDKKLKFDDGLAREDGVTGTPNFFVDGQFINNTDGGSLTINGQTIEYEATETKSDFTNLLRRIIAVKLGQPDPGSTPSTVADTSVDTSSSDSNPSE